MEPIEIIDVNAGNLEDVGFFCYMSKRKTAPPAERVGASA